MRVIFLCAKTDVVVPQIGIAMRFLLQIRMSWLRAKGMGAGVLGVCVVSWVSARYQLAEHTGAGVSWLCVL